MNTPIPSSDAELDALAVIVDSMERLQPQERWRIIRYLTDRYCRFSLPPKPGEES